MLFNSLIEPKKAICFIQQYNNLKSISELLQLDIFLEIFEMHKLYAIWFNTF